MQFTRRPLTRRLLRVPGLAGLLLGSLTPLSMAKAQQAPGSSPAEPVPHPSAIEFQPGVRIDWRTRQVEVQGRVILREGPIELFACSPRTREHESIVCIDARPMHVFQALGLIGLTPGHPSRFEPQTREYRPATGDPVEIEVQYTTDGQVRREPISRWMRHARTGDPARAGSDVEDMPWVFAGSYLTDHGVFAADPEGTVISLVDFGSSLIALPEYHSDSNAELWLEPATERIPPLMTRCTLIFRPGPILIDLDAAGRVRLSGRTLTLAETAEALRERLHEDPRARFRLRVDPRCPPDRESALLTIMDLVRIPRESLTVYRTSVSSPLHHDSEALARWMRSFLTTETVPSASRPTAVAAPRLIAADLAARVRLSRTGLDELLTGLRQAAETLQSALHPATAPTSLPADPTP